MRTSIQWLAGLGVALAVTACSKPEAQSLANAQSLIDKRDLTAAVIEIKSVLEKNPGSAAARLMLGRTLLQYGDPAAALIELSKAESAQAPADQVLPEVARAMLATGDTSGLVSRFATVKLNDPKAQADLLASLAAAHAALDDLDAARGAVAQSLVQQPGNVAAILMEARLDAAEGKAESALGHLSGLLERDRANEAAGLLKSDVLLLAQGNSEAALKALRDLLAARPDSVPALTASAALLLEQGRIQEVRALYEQLKKVAPKHGDTQLLEAQLAFQDKDYRTTREITERLLSARPNNLRLLLLAAGAEFQMQRHTLAQGLLGRALKGAPGYLPARHLLAQSFMQSGQPEKAIEVLQRVIEPADADGASLGLAGEAYLMVGDSRRSEAAFARAARLAPQDLRVQTSQALARLASGDVAAAAGQLERLARTDPGIQADQALISVRLRQGDLKAALQAVDALAIKLPGSVLPLVLRGRVLAQQNDTAGAAAAFQAALSKEPGNFQATAGLAAMDFVAGRHDAARQRLKAAIGAQPTHLPARLALAELETRLGAPDSQVLSVLREAVKVDPSQAQAHLALIERLLSIPDGQAAAIAAQDAAAALPDSPAIQDALGRAQMATGDFQRAAASFKRHATLQPRQTAPLVRLAEAQAALKEYTAAAATLRQAQQLAPDDPAVLRGQARLALANGQPAEATDVARKAQKLDPKDPFGFALEGEVASMAGDWAAAAAAYAAALQRSGQTDFALKRHHALRQAGKAAEADRLASEWLAAHPKDAQFHFYLGDQYSRAKEWAKAESEYRAVLALRPAHGSAMNNIAWLMAMQRKPGAVAMAERAVALLPDRPQYLDTLALALEAEQQLPKAVEIQKKALELDPTDNGLRWRLAQLLIKNGDTSAARKELETLGGLGTRFAGHAEVTKQLQSLR